MPIDLCGRATTRLQESIAEHIAVFRRMLQDTNPLETAAERMVRAFLGGRKVLWCGNGGSAADCQHLAAELVGRFRHERRPFASLALTTDTSVLTAISNDYGYDEVFRRQIVALCNKDDVVVGLSTSGSSVNVLLALEKAREIGAFTVAMTGESGGRVAAAADASICIPSKNTARIQEAHIFCGHYLCDIVESELALTWGL